MDSSLSFPAPNLPYIPWCVVYQLVDHLWREASWLFAVRQIGFFVWSSAPSLLPEWNSSFWTSHPLLHVILPPFSALVLLSFLEPNSLLCPSKTHVFCLFGTSLFWILSGKTSFINSSLLCPIYMNTSTYNVLLVHPAVFCSLPVLPKSLLEVIFNF